MKLPARRAGGPIQGPSTGAKTRAGWKGKRMNRSQIMNGRRPFSSVWQAATLLDCSERRVYHHIQEGRLPLAFDISRPGGERIYIRLATSSVTALQRRRRPPSDLDQFLAEALPEAQFSYKAPQVARMLECDPDHIYRLIAANVLEDVGGSTRYRVPRESLVRFLRERRVK
jgi:hypothetical protein